MKNMLKSFSREQLTGVGAFACAALLLLLGIAGGGESSLSDSGELPAPGIRDFVKPPVLEPRIPGSEFSSYWRGHDVFQMESSTRPPVPRIGMMFPHESPVVPPILRPHPAMSVYNTLSTAWPSPGVVKPEDLPAEEKLGGIKALVEPPQEEWVDTRAEREREHDVLVFQSGNPREGTIISEDEDSVRLQVKDGTAVQKWPKNRIKKILRNWTNEERYVRWSTDVQKGVTEVGARIKLAAWCHMKGMIPEARAELEKAVRVKPVKASAILALGKHLEFEFDYENALKLYRGSLDQIPSEREELHWRIGRILENLQLYGAALRAYEEGVEAASTPRGILSHARMLLQLGRSSEVIEIVTDFQKKFDRDTIRFTPALRVEAHSVLGRARLSEGDFAGAISDLKKVFSSGEGEAATIAEAWNALGVCHAMEARYLEASEAFSNALLKDQYRMEAWTNLATLYLLSGNSSVAHELFSMARERDPSDRTAHAVQALSLITGADSSGVETLLAEDPTDQYLNYLQGVMLLKNGSCGDAYAAFQSTLQEDFSFVPAYAGAGRSCLVMAARLDQMQGDGDTSVERARTVLGPLVSEILGEGGLLDPEKIGAYQDRLVLQAKTFYERLGAVLGEGRSNLQIAYGCLEALAGNGEAATERFREAKALNSQEGNPTDPVIEYGLGYVEYRYGEGSSEERLSQARRAFRSASNAVEWKDLESVRILAEAGRMSKEIEEWGMTSLVEDEDFTREDSDHLRWRGSRWIEEDGPPRASVVLKGKECLITGTPSENMIVTRVERDDLPPQEFNRLDVTFRPRHQERPSFEFGVSFYDPGRQGANRNGLHVGFDLKRKIRQTQMPEKKFLDERIEMSRQWKELPLKFALPREIKMRFQKVEENRRSVLQVLVWRPETESYEGIGKLNLRSSSRSGKSGMKISFWARGWQGDAFTVGVDDIRILEKRKR